MFRGPVFLCALICISMSLAHPVAFALDDGEQVQYTCPPCGCSEAGKPVSKPGTCPQCDMSLVPIMKYSQHVTSSEKSSRPKAAILIFEGVQIIDYTGPYEILGQADFEVFTVAPQGGELLTNMSMKVVPHYSFKDAPEADILLIPGGGVRTITQDPEAIRWIKQRAEASKHVLTVCNGAYILAETGLLNGRTATTFYGLIDGLRQGYPKIDVISDQRYVDNGKFITTAGLTSGMDGTLYLVSKLKGEHHAQRVALNLEYDWKNDSNYARADFVDFKYLRYKLLTGYAYPMIDAPDTLWTLLKTEGDANHWRLAWDVTGKTSVAALQRSFADKFVADMKWQKLKTEEGIVSWAMPKAMMIAGLEIRKTEKGHRVALNIDRQNLLK